jgi:arylsulfatase A-like enzyme
MESIISRYNLDMGYPFAVLLVCMVAFCGGCSREPTSDLPYNVVLISVDTLRADKLNSYGYEKYLTSPNMDALARDGILFENHITSAPWTTPAHLSILTSLKPSSHGMIHSFSKFKEEFRGNQGFYSLAKEKSTLAEVLAAQKMDTGAFTAGGPMDPRLGFSQGFETYTTSMYKLGKANMAKMYEWITKRKKRKFFLFWHHFEVHAPYLHGDYLDKVVPRDVARLLNEKFDDLASLSDTDDSPMGSVAGSQRGRQRDLLKQKKVFDARTCEALYAGGILAADRWLGDFVKRLKQLQLYDNTLIVLTSDHGDEFGDHDPELFYDKHGHTVYEEMVHVPLIVKLPDQKYKGKRIFDVTRAVDLMPTILDLQGATPAQHEMQGISLRPMWENENHAEPRTALVEGSAKKYEKKSLRDGQHKYIITMSVEQVEKSGRKQVPKKPAQAELYDLADDPTERKQLIGKGEQHDNRAKIYDGAIRKAVAGSQADAVPVELDSKLLKTLKGLGYVE